jgi:hypothetical protein
LTVPIAKRRGPPAAGLVEFVLVTVRKVVDAEPALSTIKRDVYLRGVTITGPARYADELCVLGPGAASSEPAGIGERSMATVNFDDSNEDPIPAAHRAEYQRVIKSLIDELRPVAETWTVVSRRT